MQTQQHSRNTGGLGSNRRYKRSSEELDHDVNKVDALVASGKYNQIEALNEVGLQSSVYHYRKRELNEPVARSVKPRKSQLVKKALSERKNNLMERIEASKSPVKPKANDNKEMEKLQEELEAYKLKYNKLRDYVLDNVVLK